MNIEQFNAFVNDAYSTCPINTRSVESLNSEAGIKQLLELAFKLGAGVAMMVLKSQGVDEIEKSDITNYMKSKTMQILLGIAPEAKSFSPDTPWRV